MNKTISDIVKDDFKSKKIVVSTLFYVNSMLTSVFK